MSAILLESDLVHYEVLGRGKPVLFLHSWIGSWRYWIPNMQYISTGFRSYSVDMWGFGDSAKNRKYLIKEQTELLVQFLDRLGIFKIAIVGHGLGALIAIELAKIMPDLVDRILAISIPFESEMITPRLLNNSATEYMDVLVSKGMEVDAVMTEILKTDQDAIIAISTESSSMEISSLINLDVSCLFVHGKNDPFISVPNSNQILQLPEQHHEIIFEQSGHFPMLEESSKFNRLLIDFLSLETEKNVRELSLKEEWKRKVR
jgi:pimeloyl-ACP methyl ester carboxylesterase